MVEGLYIGTPPKKPGKYILVTVRKVELEPARRSIAAGNTELLEVWAGDDCLGITEDFKDAIWIYD